MPGHRLQNDLETSPFKSTATFELTGEGWMRGYGSSAPALLGTGWAPGALFGHIDAAGNSRARLYVNMGDKTASLFVPMGFLAAPSINFPLNGASTSSFVWFNTTNTDVVVYHAYAIAVAGTTGACTLDLKKVPSGSAFAAGTSLLSSPQSIIAVTGLAANTLRMLPLVAVSATLTVASSEALAVVFSAAVTGLDGGVLTIEYYPI